MLEHILLEEGGLGESLEAWLREETPLMHSVEQLMGVELERRDT